MRMEYELVLIAALRILVSLLSFLIPNELLLVMMLSLVPKITNCNTAILWMMLQVIMVFVRLQVMVLLMVVIMV